MTGLSSIVFPDDFSERPLANEADVEVRFIRPLLRHLYYTDNDIHPKYNVIFQEGRSGRPHEADFAVFDGPDHSKNTSLLVIEVKGPKEELKDGKKQGESYAANLRVPFLYLTNGHIFELWQLQLTAESSLVLSGSVSSINEKLAELEGLISKPAAIQYAISLRQKTVGISSTNLTPYYHSELNRTNGHLSIARQLYPFGGDASGKILSSEILDKFTSGAVILGPSGYGKSTLAVSLFRQAISDCLSTELCFPVFHLELPDVAEAGKSIVQYATDRLLAYCPQITESVLKHLLHNHGAILICDRFDRPPRTDRENFLSQFKTLRRDHPKIQLFIFSRISMRPNIELPIFELKAYSDEEQIESVKIAQGDHVSFHIRLIPKALDPLFKIPLLFNLGFQHWLSHQSFPNDLNTLFRSWIDCLLKTNTLQPTQKIHRERGLRLFAIQSIGGSLRPDKAIELFRENGLAETMLDDLIQSDVLIMTGYSVELAHEALGDYLRAAELVEREHNVLARELSTMAIDVDSMFPVLLAAQLKNHQLQRILFARLATLDLPTYFEALRYRADVSSEVLSGTQEEFAKIYLEDMLDGIEQPMGAFFSLVAAYLIRSLTNSNSPELSVVGEGDAECINYAFQPADRGQRITIGSIVDQKRIHGVNLKSIGTRADSGRILGVSILKDEVLQMPEQRRLIGGIEWRSERLVGWIRFLSHRFNLGIDLDQPLDQLYLLLSPLKDQVININAGSFFPKGISINTALEDMDALRNRGDRHLNVWWTQFGNAHHSPLENEENTRQLFNEFYRRVQIIYREVVEYSFNSISASFGFYNSLPVRWDIALRIQQDSWRPPWAHYSWRPVENWGEAGADFEFTDNTPERFLNWDVGRIQKTLRRLGRLTPYSRIWTGSSVIPHFDGNSMTGEFGGETPIIEEVCHYIEEDLKHLFKLCPSSDIPF